MGNIARRANGQWRARYRDPAGHEHAKHFRRKVDAQKWLDAATTAIGTGSWTDPAAARTTVAEWAPQWLETKVNLKATTRAAYEVLVNRHILPRWGRRPGCTLLRMPGAAVDPAACRQASVPAAQRPASASRSDVRPGRIQRSAPPPPITPVRRVRTTSDQVRRPTTADASCRSATAAAELAPDRGVAEHDHRAGGQVVRDRVEIGEDQRSLIGRPPVGDPSDQDERWARCAGPRQKRAEIGISADHRPRVVARRCEHHRVGRGSQAELARRDRIMAGFAQQPGDAVRGGTSCGVAQRQFTLAHRFGCVVQCFLDVARLEIREVRHDLGHRHPVSNHADHRRDRHAHPADAGHPAHHLGICGDAGKRHLAAPAR